MRVRRLTGTSSHVNRIARWLNEEWGTERGFSLADTLEWCLDVAEARHEALFGALAGRTLVGTALLVGRDLESEPELGPWLSGLYVAPAHRGRTVGASLVAAVEEAARAGGHQRLYLHCRAGPLERYYRDLGWQPAKAIEVDGRPFAVMSRSLDGRAPQPRHERSR